MTHNTPDQREARFVIAIDGPAGAGKSTIASLLARRLGIPYLDTGAMYRAVALLALRSGLTPPLDEAAEEAVLELMADHTVDVEVERDRTVLRVDDEDVSAQIRSPECSLMASAVSAMSGVRRQLVELQRSLGRRHGGVMEGRDIGTVVFPDARLKVFLTASPEERARRRYLDLIDRDPGIRLEEVQRQQQLRDRQDSSRRDSPLQVARGAVVVDTSRMTPDQVVERLLAELERSPVRVLDSTEGDAVRSRNDVS